MMHGHTVIYHGAFTIAADIIFLYSAIYYYNQVTGDTIRLRYCRRIGSLGLSGNSFFNTAVKWWANLVYFIQCGSENKPKTSWVLARVYIR